MPDEKGKLTPDDTQAVVQWLTKKVLGDRSFCPQCNHGNQEIGDRIVAPMNLVGNGIALGGELFPVVVVTCANCGYTRYFNAVIMGLLKNQQAAQEKEATPEQKDAAGGADAP